MRNSQYIRSNKIAMSRILIYCVLLLLLAITLTMKITHVEFGNQLFLIVLGIVTVLAVVDFKNSGFSRVFQK